MSTATEISTVTRIFDAPRDKVWTVVTEPQYFAQWFGAVPGSVELDVRSGGSWKASVAGPEGATFPLAGRYVEVARPERLVLTVPNPGGGEVEATITLTDLGDGRTEETFSAPVVAEASAEAEAGTNMIMDKIAGILRTL